jgi:DHA2 family methylenomycin A resistance protein-like MFS transporter
VSSLALPLGPLAGGVLVDRFGWPAVFWINVPVVAVAFALAARIVSESSPARGRRLDVPGQVLVTVGIGLLVGGLVEAGELGWDAPAVVLLLAGGAAAVAGFVAWEMRAPDPMVPAELVRRPGFVPANAVGLLMNFGGVGTLYLIPLLLQVVQGRSPLASGLLLLPATLPLAVLAPACARLAERVGWRTPMVVGMATAAVSGVLMVVVRADATALVVGTVLLVLGVGLTLNTAPMVGAVMATAPPAHRSLASASNNTARQIGSALGVAVLGTIAGDPGSSGFVSGLHRAGLVAAAGWALAALLATLAPSRQGEEDRVRSVQDPRAGTEARSSA